jgi:hypothetical protein
LPPDSLLPLLLPPLPAAKEELVPPSPRIARAPTSSSATAIAA